MSHTSQTISGLAHEGMRPEHAQPALEIDLGAGDIGHALKTALGQRDLGRRGSIRIKGTTSPKDFNELDDKLEISLDIEAVWGNQPAILVHRIDLSIAVDIDEGTLQKTSYVHEVVLEGVASRIAEWIAAERPEAAAPFSIMGTVAEVGVGGNLGCYRAEGRIWCHSLRGDPVLPVPGMDGSVAFDVGESTVCSIKEAGDVWCKPALGVHSIESYQAFQVCGVTGAASVSVNRDTGCVSGSKGVRCFTLPTEKRPCTEQEEVWEPTKLRAVQQVSVGLLGCAIDTEAGVVCWSTEDRKILPRSRKKLKSARDLVVTHSPFVLDESGHKIIQLRERQDYTYHSDTEFTSLLIGERICGLDINGSPHCFDGDTKTFVQVSNLRGVLVAAGPEGIVLVEDNDNHAVHHFGGYRDITDNNPLSTKPMEQLEALLSTDPLEFP